MDRLPADSNFQKNRTGDKAQQYPNLNLRQGSETHRLEVFTFGQLLKHDPPDAKKYKDGRALENFPKVRNSTDENAGEDLGFGNCLQTPGDAIWSKNRQFLRFPDVALFWWSPWSTFPPAPLRLQRSHGPPAWHEPIYDTQ